MRRRPVTVVRTTVVRTTAVRTKGRLTTATATRTTRTGDRREVTTARTVSAAIIVEVTPGAGADRVVIMAITPAAADRKVSTDVDPRLIVGPAHNVVDPRLIAVSDLVVGSKVSTVVARPDIVPRHIAAPVQAVSTDADLRAIVVPVHNAADQVAVGRRSAAPVAMRADLRTVLRPLIASLSTSTRTKMARSTRPK